ncbi:MAG: AmmeMemoRadiSam system protein B [Eubacteriaceae bacterium]|jgi:aromatic ring-opening dioxygenase LigB subunit|nr:AmmeMemoRadiSam system protein B [Eubacteriaceae bacterium]
MKDYLLAGAIMPHPPIIVPEIGGRDALKAEKTTEGIDKLSQQLSDKQPETVIVITPHGNMFRDAISIQGLPILTGHFGNYGHREVTLTKENDCELADMISKMANKKRISTVYLDEETTEQYHLNPGLDQGVMVPLYFLSQYLKDYRLIVITYGLLSREKLIAFGEIMKLAINALKRPSIIIASGDLSHRLKNEGPYDFHPAGPAFDQSIVELVEENRLEGIRDLPETLTENAGECGLRSILILVGALNQGHYDSNLISYEGPFGVGYLNAFIDLKE